MIINKILNTLTLDGKKKTSEKLLKKSFKRIQKDSKKPLKNIIQQALVNATPSLKINKIQQKKGKKKRIKELPSFIKKTEYKVAYAIKLIFKNRGRKGLKAEHKIKNEVFQSFNNEGYAVNKKNELQQKALARRRLFAYYRW